MAVNTKQLKIAYAGDVSGVKSALGQIDKMHSTLGSKLKSFGSKMSSAGKSATTYLTLPLIGLGVAATSAFAESEKAAAQTEAVIKSTGGAANVTGTQIAKLSEKLGKLAAVSDEEVQAGANMLLTFTNIRNETGKGNDVFNQSLSTLTDMSAALGTDVKSSAIQLGKALNDPIKGVTALSRVGVTFTEATKDQIATLVENGDVMGAQKIILAELQTEFGGSAKAAGATASPMKKMALTLDRIAEVIGSFVAPMLEKLAGWLDKVATWFQNLSPGMQQTIVTVLAVVAAIGPLLLILGKVVSMIGVIAGLNPFVLIAAAVIAIAILIFKNWDRIKAFLLAVWRKLRDVWRAVWGAMKAVFLTIWNVIKSIAKAYFAFWKAVFNAVKAVALTVWRAIVAVIKAVWNVIKSIAQAYMAFWKAVFNAVKAVALTVWHGIVTVVQTVWGKLKSIGLALKGFFVGIWRVVKDAAVTAFNGVKDIALGVWDAISGAFKAVWNGIAAAWNNTIGAFSFRVPDWVPGIGGRGFDMPDLPTLYRGGRVFGAGLAVVGERGPEIVSLPRGAQVHPNGITPAAPGFVVNVTVQGSVIAERDLAICVRDELLRVQRRNGQLSGIR